MKAAVNNRGIVSILDTTVANFDTYFVGASEDGENLYISSAAPLAPEDQDGSRDLYDVRAGGGKLYIPLSPGCEADGLACQPLASSEPPATPHASESGRGGGNPPLPQQGVEGYVTGPVTVRSHSTRGSRLKLVLKAPGTGILQVTGSGLTTLKRFLPGAETYTLELPLAPRAAAALRHHHKLKVAVHVQFRPTNGMPSRASFTAAFR